MSLMMLGPFIFAVPTFSAEALNRKVSGRVQSPEVIGAAPPTHLLGPNGDTIEITSTFYPHHLNGAGLAQLRGVQAAARAQIPLMFVSIGGLVFGRWIINSVDEAQTFFHPKTGTPQRVEVGMSLTQYVGGGGLGGISFGVF